MYDVIATYWAPAIAAVVFLIYGISRLRARSRKRSEDIKQWCYRNGFEFIEGPIDGHRLAETKLLDDSTARNVARSPRVTLFDLRQSRGTGGDTSTLIATSALFQMERPLPTFAFMAATAGGPDSVQGQILSKIMNAAQALAEKRGDKKGILMFEKRPGFFVHTEDMDAAKRVFSDDRLSFFDDKTGWMISANGSWLIATKKDVVAPENYDELLHTAQSIHDHFFHSSS